LGIRFSSGQGILSLSFLLSQGNFRVFKFVATARISEGLGSSHSFGSFPQTIGNSENKKITEEAFLGRDLSRGENVLSVGDHTRKISKKRHQKFGE
jgi:hypothetical protein